MENVIAQQAWSLDEMMRFALNFGVGALFALLVIVALLWTLRALIGSMLAALREIPAKIDDKVDHFDTQLDAMARTNSQGFDRVVDKLEALSSRQEAAIDKLTEATSAQTVQNAQTGKALEILLTFITQNMTQLAAHRGKTEVNPPPLGVIVPVEPRKEMGES